MADEVASLERGPQKGWIAAIAFRKPVLARAGPRIRALEDDRKVTLTEPHLTSGDLAPFQPSPGCVSLPVVRELQCCIVKPNQLHIAGQHKRILPIGRLSEHWREWGQCHYPNMPASSVASGRMTDFCERVEPGLSRYDRLRSRAYGGTSF